MNDSVLPPVTAPSDITQDTILDLVLPWLGPSYEERFMKYAEPVFMEERFWTWPASIQKHHACHNGLARHTYEVLELCIATASTSLLAARTDRLVITLGALWHDIGKVDEYRYVSPVGNQDGHWSSATAKRYGITHIMSGLMRWSKTASAAWEREFHIRIAHLIASHHGRLEWGSPVTPVSHEALILHQADMASVMADSGVNPQNRSTRERGGRDRDRDRR